MDKINIDAISKFSHLLATDIECDNFESSIIDTIYNSDRMLTDETIVEALQSVFKITVAPVKVHSRIRKLINDKRIHYEGSYIVLNPTTIENISQIVDENKKLEAVASGQWLDDFRKNIDDEISIEQSELIKETIIRYISGFFLIHGAGSFSLIIGNKECNSIDIKTLAEHSIQEITGFYKVKLGIFLEKIFTQELSNEQKRFCIKQINKAVGYLATVVDDDIRNSILEKLQGITVYLDTPILYRLLNLQGESRYSVIVSLVNYCKENHIELKVFQKTIEELKRRIQYDARLIEKYPYPVDFATIGYKCRTSENYLSTFWRARAKTGISAKDFNFMYKDITKIITEHGLIIDTENHMDKYDLEKQKEFLYSKVSSFSAKDPEYSKSANSIEHDAVCLAIIEHLRKPNAITAFDASVVFLTSDWSLIRLQKYDPDYQDKADLAVLPSQLMQLFCITQANDTYYETFLGLFSSSKTIFGTNKLSNDCIQEIIGRVTYYKGVTPEFAERVLCNKLIQDTFTTMESEEEQFQLIDDVMLSEVELMEIELKSKNERLLTVEADRNEKDNTIEEMERRLLALEEANNNMDNQLIDYNKYQLHFEKSIESKAKVKAIVRLIVGWIILAVAMINVLLCVVAFIPQFSGKVKPVFDWLLSAETINQDGANNLTVIGIALPLFSSLLVLLGRWIVSPGYKGLIQKYIIEYNDSI